MGRDAQSYHTLSRHRFRRHVPTADARYKAVVVPRLGFMLKRVLRIPDFDPVLYRSLSLSADEKRNLRAVALEAQGDRFPDALTYIGGVMPRSGTNMLYNALLHDSRFRAPPIPIDELGLLADPEQFDERTRIIGEMHGPSGDAFGRLEWLAYAVSGLRRRLIDTSGRGVITVVKEPHAYNIGLLPLLLPQDRIILVVRDGRYIVDSFMRSFVASRRFGRTFKDVCMEFAVAAQNVLDLVEHADPRHVSVVKFEDLVNHRERCIGTLINWIGLAPDPTAMATVAAMPVYGSSTHSLGRDGKVDWTPVVANTDFDPVARPLRWSATQCRIFESLCGPVNRRWGYGLDADIGV